MNIQSSLIALLLIFSFSAAWADSSMTAQKRRYAAFEELLQKDDYKGAEKLLLDWQRESPNDAELAVGWGNYYGQMGQQPIRIHAGDTTDDTNVDQARGNTYPMMKPGTTETVGIIDTRPQFDDAMLTRALAALLDGATSHPARTDIWMGATHIQMIANDYDGAFNTLVKFAEATGKNSKKLLTRYDEPVEDKIEEFIPKTLHAYALRGYSEETTAGAEFLLRVARLAQKLYPEHPYAYNDEAVYYSDLEDDNKVLECLERAHKVRPQDALVTMNIASTYKNMNQKAKAREYYKKTISIAKDEELKAAAKEELEGLSGE